MRPLSSSRKTIANTTVYCGSRAAPLPQIATRPPLWEGSSVPSPGTLISSVSAPNSALTFSGVVAWAIGQSIKAANAGSLREVRRRLQWIGCRGWDSNGRKTLSGTQNAVRSGPNILGVEATKKHPGPGGQKQQLTTHRWAITVMPKRSADRCRSHQEPRKRCPGGAGRECTMCLCICRAVDSFRMRASAMFASL